MQAPTKTEIRSEDDSQRWMPQSVSIVAWLILAVAFVGLYWQSINKLGRVWWTQEDYQHGFFVPLFSIYLLWFRREMILPFIGRGSWWGLALFAVWALMRWTANFMNYETLPEASMIPFFLGFALFVGGWQGLRWAWPAILFLVFMIPLPGFIQSIARLQMQLLATKMSVFAIQTLGIPAVSDSVVIQLTDKPLRVEEACSGLRMLSLFFGGCVGAAFIIRRPLWEKLLLVLSAVPIAIISNVVRIVVTGIVYDLSRHLPAAAQERAEHFVHDAAGYLMPVVGLILLFTEIKLLSKLLIEPLPERPLVLGQLAAAGSSAKENRTMRTEK